MTHPQAASAFSRFDRLVMLVIGLLFLPRANRELFGDSPPGALS